MLVRRSGEEDQVPKCSYQHRLLRCVRAAIKFRQKHSREAEQEVYLEEALLIEIKYTTNAGHLRNPGAAGIKMNFYGCYFLCALGGDQEMRHISDIEKGRRRRWLGPLSP